MKVIYISKARPVNTALLPRAKQWPLTTVTHHDILEGDPMVLLAVEAESDEQARGGGFRLSQPVRLGRTDTLPKRERGPSTCGIYCDHRENEGSLTYGEGSITLPIPIHAVLVSPHHWHFNPSKRATLARILALHIEVVNVLNKKINALIMQSYHSPSNSWLRVRSFFGTSLIN